MNIKDFATRWALHYVNPDFLKIPLNTGMLKPVTFNFYIEDPKGIITTDWMTTYNISPTASYSPIAVEDLECRVAFYLYDKIAKKYMEVVTFMDQEEQKLKAKIKTFYQASGTVVSLDPTYTALNTVTIYFPPGEYSLIEYSVTRGKIRTKAVNFEVLKEDREKTVNIAHDLAYMKTSLGPMKMEEQSVFVSSRYWVDPDSERISTYSWVWEKEIQPCPDPQNQGSYPEDSIVHLWCPTAITENSLDLVCDITYPSYWISKEKEHTNSQIFSVVNTYTRGSEIFGNPVWKDVHYYTTSYDKVTDLNGLVSQHETLPHYRMLINGEDVDENSRFRYRFQTDSFEPMGVQWMSHCVWTHGFGEASGISYSGSNYSDWVDTTTWSGHLSSWKNEWSFSNNYTAEQTWTYQAQYGIIDTVSKNVYTGETSSSHSESISEIEISRHHWTFARPYLGQDESTGAWYSTIPSDFEGNHNSILAYYMTYNNTEYEDGVLASVIVKKDAFNSRPYNTYPSSYLSINGTEDIWNGYSYFFFQTRLQEKLTYTIP